jgi:hypothetical protein
MSKRSTLLTERMHERCADGNHRGDRNSSKAGDPHGARGRPMHNCSHPRRDEAKLAALANQNGPPPAAEMESGMLKE